VKTVGSSQNIGARLQNYTMSHRGSVRSLWLSVVSWFNYWCFPQLFRAMSDHKYKVY